MDDTEYVSLFCTHLALADKGTRAYHAFYLFQDTRPGTVTEKVEQDAQEYARVFNATQRGRKVNR